LRRSNILTTRADSQVRNWAANGLTALAESFCFRKRHFSAIFAENSKARRVSSLSVESLKIAMKAPESRLAADDGLELSRSLWSSLQPATSVELKMELILLITGLATAGGLVLTLAPIPMMKMLFA
jgi:hypothetical protein